MYFRKRIFLITLPETFVFSLLAVHTSAKLHTVPPQEVQIHTRTHTGLRKRVDKNEHTPPTNPETQSRDTNNPPETDAERNVPVHNDPAADQTTTRKGFTNRK